ncbi:MAG: hypothetical protein DWQ01_00230 [Planctomycetota bacterium]|nr:MAG: hypothetical protein DWQ01_00230 [Planctomycetota bacterium]
MDRRKFLKDSLALTGGLSLPGIFGQESEARAQAWQQLDDFQRRDSRYHGDGWESLNPGFWKIENGSLRRQLRQYGDRARATGFPFHYETHQKRAMPTDYDPSLPFGMLWRRDYYLTESFGWRMEATIQQRPPAPPPEDDPKWKMYQAGYGLLGLGFGSKHLFAGWRGNAKNPKAPWMLAWRDDGRFGLYQHASGPKALVAEVQAPAPRPGDQVQFEVRVEKQSEDRCRILGWLRHGHAEWQVQLDEVDFPAHGEGYPGLVARGLLDFQVDRVEIQTSPQQRLQIASNECLLCYPLGDSLQNRNGHWTAKFMALFRQEGSRATIRIATQESPPQGWDQVAVAGEADIVSNDFRMHTAVITAELPGHPAETTHYFTIWKDRVDVTSDPRLGTDAVGPGTGFLGTVPASGRYVGRLPQLQAPYRLCGLSCHAIHGRQANLPDPGQFGRHYVRDQPTPEAYRHLEAYDFQIMVWEDDIWYLELLLYPPSPDDAYKIITTTLAGPATRWQMMRHWNVLNPGDHDYGMDDVKGPEQLAIRRLDDLGQDRDYMRRNFQIVQHLIRGEENPSPTSNPKRWRRWRLPHGDFSLLIVDARLWRTSQDTAIWAEQGWGHHRDLYSRKDPTRSLLGEEQFAWLQQVLRTDPSPWICLTGLNGLHTIWAGTNWDGRNQIFADRDRVAADYAGWVSAGVDRVLELLGGRSGVVSVYGDVHNGSILRNLHHRLYECSFGPIGRSGGRAVIPGFGRRMQDLDGRELEVLALYHARYQNPELEPRQPPYYWNFLEMEFDPRGADPQAALKIRNLIDSPEQAPRGGGHARFKKSSTGRLPQSWLPSWQSLAYAEIQLSLPDGQPLCAVRALADGRVPATPMPNLPPQSKVLYLARSGEAVQGGWLKTLRSPENGD